MLEEDALADEADRDMFTLFWKAITLPKKKALPYFQE